MLLNVLDGVTFAHIVGYGSSRHISRAMIDIIYGVKCCNALSHNSRCNLNLTVSRIFFNDFNVESHCTCKKNHKHKSLYLS